MLLDRVKVLILVLALTLWVFPSPLQAEVILLDYGLLQSTLDGQARFQIPDQAEPISRPSSHQVVATVEKATIKPGLTIGIAWAATELNSETTQIKLTIRHPEIHTPDGLLARGRVSEFNAAVVDGIAAGVAGYSFIENHTFVSGEWEFELEVDGKAVKHTFELQ